jgi:hypothetical protein
MKSGLYVGGAAVGVVLVAISGWMIGGQRAIQHRYPQNLHSARPQVRLVGVDPGIAEVDRQMLNAATPNAIGFELVDQHEQKVYLKKLTGAVPFLTDFSRIAADKVKLNLGNYEINETSHQQSVTQTIKREIDRPLNKWLHELQNSDLRRARFEILDRQDSMTAKVVIERPSPQEISRLLKVINSSEYYEALSDHSQTFFVVDAQRLADEFLHFSRQYHILYLALFKDGSSEHPGIYWTFDSDSTEGYGIKPEGDPQVPEGIYPARSRQWLSNWKAPQRYAHLFQRF